MINWRCVAQPPPRHIEMPLNRFYDGYPFRLMITITIMITITPMPVDDFERCPTCPFILNDAEWDSVSPNRNQITVADSPRWQLRRNGIPYFRKIRNNRRFVYRREMKASRKTTKREKSRRTNARTSGVNGCGHSV